MKIKLLFPSEDKEDRIDRRLYRIKFIKDLFGLGLKEAKDAVDSGEFIPIYFLKNVFSLIRKSTRKSVKN